MERIPTPNEPDKELTDLYHALASLSGEISLRLLFRRMLIRAKHEKKITAAEISRKTRVAGNSISGFRNGRSGMTIDSFEKVINYILKSEGNERRKN